jgi:hypothetical protein
MKTTKVRMIENPNKRIINFLFVNPFPILLNEFSNRLRKMFDNKLDDYITNSEEAINVYMDKIKNDEIDEDELESSPYPITVGVSPHLTFDISNIGCISLAASDDPFFKVLPHHQKYFPEMVCYNKEGELIERINGDTYESLKDKNGLTKTKGVFHYD